MNLAKAENFIGDRKGMKWFKVRTQYILMSGDLILTGMLLEIPRRWTKDEDMEKLNRVGSNITASIICTWSSIPLKYFQNSWIWKSWWRNETF